MGQLFLEVLLGCAAANQERGQALVGQLGLWELQVDVVPHTRWDDFGWMAFELWQRWREE